jgi:hypothetical protein
MSTRKTRLKKYKLKRKSRQRRIRPSEAVMGAGAGLAMFGAIPYALGAKAQGKEVMGAGLGLAGAGVGLAVLEGLGENIRKTAKRGWR